ncbi:MAG: hypothetical protein ACJ798_03280 [Phenylobacterium sp.]
MKSLLFASACGLVLATAVACAPSGPPAARASLDCPTSQGDLNRTSVAPDGKTCLYTTRDGDEVSLRLIPVSSGSYQSALTPIEQELQGEVQTEQEVAAAKVKEADENAKAAATDAKSSSASAKGAAQAAKQAADDALGEVKAAEAEAKDAADVGATTRIDLPGIHINADEKGKADVDVGMIHVNAGEDGATVRMAREVRLRGEALSPTRRGFRASYILAKDNLKDGWRAVGYEAAGPKAGPITVAVVKSRTGDHHDVLDDVKRLVRRNAGV